MSQWVVREGLEYEIQMDDVEFQERYEDAFAKMGETEKTLQKTGKLSELTRGYCKMFYTLFDDIFGKGAGEKIFEGKLNTSLCDEVYESFIDTCSADVRRINATRQKMVSKFKPKKGKR